jgi:hypothetical protein
VKKNKFRISNILVDSDLNYLNNLDLGNEQILDLDILYSNVSPPSEINENYSYSPRSTYIYFISFLEKSVKSNAAEKCRSRKRNNFNSSKIVRKNPVMNNPGASIYEKGIKYCHQCHKKNSTSNYDFYQCADPTCEKYYCGKCIKSYSNVAFNVCFACKKLCKCEECRLNMEVEEEYDFENVENRGNLVKIDEFVILENEGPENESDVDAHHVDIVDIVDVTGVVEDSNPQVQVKDSPSNIVRLKSIDFNETKISGQEKVYHIEEILQKIQNAVKEVEGEASGTGMDPNTNTSANFNSNSNSNLNTTQQKKECILCNNKKLKVDSTTGETTQMLLKFNSIENLMYYTEDFLNKEQMKNNSASFKSIPEFSERFADYIKVPSTTNNYAFKSAKFICINCYTFYMKQDNGFSLLFNNLHVNNKNIGQKKKDSNLSANNKVTPVKAVSNVNSTPPSTSGSKFINSKALLNQQRSNIISFTNPALFISDNKLSANTLNNNSANNNPVNINVNSNQNQNASALPNQSNTANQQVNQLNSVINQNNQNNQGNNKYSNIPSAKNQTNSGKLLKL